MTDYIQIISFMVFVSGVILFLAATIARMNAQKRMIDHLESRLRTQELYQLELMNQVSRLRSKSPTPPGTKG